VEVREEFKDLGDFASLGTLAVVAYQPLLIYLIAKRIRYTRALARMLVCTLCVIGAYLGWTGIAELYHASFFGFPEYILSPSVGIQFGRVRGPFVSSTVDGAILVITFVAIVVAASHQTGMKRWLVLSLVPPVVGSVYFTSTRSIWISFAAIATTLVCVRTNL